MPSFIVDDPHPCETVCEDWYPRYGHIYCAATVTDEVVSTPTGVTWPMDRITFIRWKNGTMYKTTRFGWPLALVGLEFEQAKVHPIYKELLDK